jgi:hypothetical protein
MHHRSYSPQDGFLFRFATTPSRPEAAGPLARGTPDLARRTHAWLPQLNSPRKKAFFEWRPFHANWRSEVIRLLGLAWDREQR